jgi:hypothetical protein
MRMVSFALRPPYPWENNLGTVGIGGWVGLREEAVEKNVLAPARNRIPVFQLVVYLLY